MQPVDGRPPASLLRDWRAWSASTGTAGAPLAAVTAVARAAAVTEGAPPALLDELAEPADRSGAGGVDDPVAQGPPAELVASTVRAAFAGGARAARDDTADRGVRGDREGPGALAVPSLLGAVYEAALLPAERRTGGVFYTPPGVAAGLVALALPDGEAVDARTVVTDPAMGGGAFLLAAAERLHRRGLDAAACVAALRGCDVDPGAVAVARTALAWWAWAIDGVVVRPAPEALRTGDGLAPAGPAGPPPGPVTAVVGNPPFLGQLRGSTARSSAQRQRLHERFGAAAKGYVDTALLFLLAGADLVGPGGRIVLVQPESALVGSHGAAARAALAGRHDLTALWVGPGGLFDAAVRVCAPVLQRRSGSGPGGGQGGADAGSGGGSVALYEGVEVKPSGRFDVDSPHGDGLPAGRWAPVLAATRGVPPVPLMASGTLADLVTATAGFRDEYYGLVPFVTECPAAPAGVPPAPPGEGGRWAQLITSGAVAIGRSRWAQRPIRFAGRPWERPVVDLEALDRDAPGLAVWVRRRLRPKLVVATQTPVLVAAVDVAGSWVPSVPVVSVEPLDPPEPLDVPELLDVPVQPDPAVLADPAVPVTAGPDALWLAAAVLTAPVVSAWAAARFAGAGLSASGLRLTARQLLELPTPRHQGPWHRAAATLRDAVAGDPVESWRRSGALMAEAYEVDDDVAAEVARWWEQAARRHLPVEPVVPGDPAAADGLSD
jgi:hypothetical protein